MNQMKEARTTLAFDLGKSVGCSIGDGGYVLSTAARVRGAEPARYLATVDYYLTEFGGCVTVEAVAIRAPSKSCGRARKSLLARAINRIREWADEHGAAMEMHDSGLVRSSWADWGNASGHVMLAEAHRRGFRIDSIEEAYALATLNLSLQAHALVAQRTAAIGAR